MDATRTPASSEEKSPSPRRRSYGTSPDAGDDSREADVVVMVENDHQDQILEVADRLREAGLRIPDGDLGIQDKIGMITGSIDPSKVDKLRNIAGVEFVRESQSYWPV